MTKLDRQVYDRQRTITTSSLLNTAKSVPCMDCKQSYPTHVMDFDHKVNKHFNIGAKRHFSISRLEEEISKCDVVCANCHRVRTFNRKLELV